MSSHLQQTRIASPTLPATSQIRQRIDAVQNVRAKRALQLQFLSASRVSEIVGAKGVKGQDCQLNTYENHPLVVFSIKTAKRQGKVRAVALPLETEFDPWTRPVVEYCQAKDDPSQLIFDLTPRMMQKYAVQAFQGLSYHIEGYEEEGKSVGPHWKNISTHGLRHIRATELMMYYGFDGIDLAIMCGWSLKSQVGMPGVASRYLYLQWSRYFPKLLKPLPS